MMLTQPSVLQNYYNRYPGLLDRTEKDFNRLHHDVVYCRNRFNELYEHGH